LNIRLENEHANLLSEEAQRVYPIEACALLFGELTKDNAFVRKVIVLQNELHSAERFEMNPESVYNAFNEAEKEGFEFIGIFHSHPAPATPSIIDLKFMKIWGDALWLILSLADYQFGAYQLKDGELREIEVQCEKETLAHTTDFS